MFASLRSRLWLSYVLIILAVLGVAAVTLVLALLGSPVLYRASIAQLNAEQAIILKEQPDLARLPLPDLQAVAALYDDTFDIRVLVYTPNRDLLADSRAGTAAAMVQPRRTQLLKPNLMLRDTSGKRWVYTARQIPGGYFLVTAIPRPRLPLLSLLRNEILLPFIEAGAVALVLSMLAAYLLARWVANPLQDVVAVSRRMPANPATPLPLRGPREVQELTLAFNDMTGRVQSSQRSQREFVANVSHELKTPITSIQGFAQAMLDGTADSPEAVRNSAGIIHDEAGRMHRMVLDLLDLARLDAGTLDLQKGPVDLAALANAVAEKLAPQARLAGVDLKVEATSMPEFNGDGDRLAQVFTNLVDNALKYTPAGGCVTLKAFQAGEALEVEVIDNGAGIPVEAQAHIFERFYQADPSRPGGKKHGAGLGLAIVREILAAHGGTISVRSEPGKGSTFTVRLPLANPEAITQVSKRKK